MTSVLISCLDLFVYSIFSHFYLAIAIGKSGTIPYTDIKSGRYSVSITGISKHVEFQEPKSYRINQLNLLLDSKENFELTGMPLHNTKL